MGLSLIFYCLFLIKKKKKKKKTDIKLGNKCILSSGNGAKVTPREKQKIPCIAVYKFLQVCVHSVNYSINYSNNRPFLAMQYF